MKALILNAIIMALCSRFFYVQGIKDADFDRQRANTKLQECIEIVRDK
jgi:hypothetical protein